MEEFWLALGSSVTTAAAIKAGDAIGPVAAEFGEDVKRLYVAARGSLSAIGTQLRLVVNPDLIGKATVRPQITMAVMQAAVGVDDPDLVSMFANMLATEMESNKVHPSFPSIIGQMTGDDARLLKAVLRERRLAGSITVRLPSGDSATAFTPGEYFGPAFYSLERLGLFERRDILTNALGNRVDTKRHQELLLALGEFLTRSFQEFDPHPNQHQTTAEVAYDASGFGLQFGHAVLPLNRKRE